MTPVELLRECLREADNDIEAGLLATEYLLLNNMQSTAAFAVDDTSHKQQEEQNTPISIFLAHDIHNRAAQGILNRTLRAAKGLSAGARTTLEEALKRGNANSGEAILTFIDKYRLQLAKLLTTSQLASLLEGAREVAAKVPQLDEDAREVTKTVGKIDTPTFNTGDTTDIHFPVIEEATKTLAEKNVLTRHGYDALEAAARAKAFAVAGVDATEALTKIRDALAKNVREGADYETFRKEVLDAVEEGTFLSEAHLETVFRTNVQGAFSDGQMVVLQHPLIRSGFPYSAYDSIHDDRVREEHKSLDSHGINGTNIYRNDDPVFKTFRPPWSYNCRCSWAPMTIRAAAEAGIKEAKEWLDTGIEPSPPTYVAMPPFEPPPGFQRALTSAPLSIQLSMQSLDNFFQHITDTSTDSSTKTDAETPLEKYNQRNVDRMARRDSVDNAIRLMRKSDLDYDKVDNQLEEAGATSAEMRALSRVSHRVRTGRYDAQKLDNLYEKIAESIHQRLDDEERADPEPEKPETPSDSALSTDAEGHAHKGKGKGGGQFTSSGGGSSDTSKSKKSEKDDGDTPLEKEPKRTLRTHGLARFKTIAKLEKMASDAVLGKGPPPTSRVGKAIAATTAWVTHALHKVEHGVLFIPKLVAHGVADGIDKAVAKLPEMLQDPIRSSWMSLVLGGKDIGSVGMRLAFANWELMQNIVGRIAKEKGQSEADAKQLRGALSAVDMKTFEVLKASAIAGVHAAHAPLQVAMVAPPATTAYLAYNSAAHPVATYRAAKSLVADALVSVKKATAGPSRPHAPGRTVSGPEELGKRLSTEDGADSSKPDTPQLP